MSIEVTCSNCNASHHVNDRMAGRRVRCPKCETVVHVPEADVVLGGEDFSTIEEAQPVEVVAVHEEPTESTKLPHHRHQSLASSREDSESPHHSVVGTMIPGDDEDEDPDEVLVRSKRPEEEMDMTPMVDVTFLLLIFFMVTAAFSLQKSIVMPRQQTDAPSSAVVEEDPDQLDVVEVQVDEFGSFLVMAPDWERETPGKQNLISSLKEAMGSNSDGMRLVIKVHEMAKLRALVDVMDAGTIAGYSELEVTQVEEFD